MKGLLTAIQTLSILPIRGNGYNNFPDSLPWFPVAGALLGTILTGLAHLCSRVQPEATAVLMLVTGTLLTRGLHLDGLADCADGFGGGHTRERILEIMKDSSTGAFGAIAIALLLLVKWVALTHLAETGNLGVVVAAYAISRAMQVEQMVRLPYARSDGTAASFVRGAMPRHRWIALAGAGVIALLLSGIQGLAGLAAAWIATALFGNYCQRRVGGITGDLLGTTSELTETLVLFLPLFTL
jgi:adenosylcobinamide-GDP ribazoletransferase